MSIKGRKFDGDWYIMDRGESKKDRPTKYINRPFKANEIKLVLEDLLKPYGRYSEWRKRLFTKQIINSKNVKSSVENNETEAA